LFDPHFSLPEGGFFEKTPGYFFPYIYI
jgi:hypothetical protein